MKVYNTRDKRYGYNLRADTERGMDVHVLTRKKYSEMYQGENNPNYNNRWNDKQRKRASKIFKERHASGDYYGKEWRTKIKKANQERMKDPDLRRQIANQVKKTKQKKHAFLQFTRDGKFVRRWDTVEEIISKNPEYKWQNIYSVCNGYKPTYRGFVWKKVLKNA